MRGGVVGRWRRRRNRDRRGGGGGARTARGRRRQDRRRRSGGGAEPAAAAASRPGAGGEEEPEPAAAASRPEAQEEAEEPEPAEGRWGGGAANAGRPPRTTKTGHSSMLGTGGISDVRASAPLGDCLSRLFGRDLRSCSRQIRFSAPDICGPEREHEQEQCPVLPALRCGSGASVICSAF